MVNTLAGRVDLAGREVPVRETTNGKFYYTHYIDERPAGPGARSNPTATPGGGPKAGDGIPGGETRSGMARGPPKVNVQAVIATAIA
jgi:hypothetical protein